MSLNSVYKELSPEQLIVLEHKKLEGSFKPKQLIKLLRNLAAYDRKNDAKRDSLSRLKSFCGVIGGLSIIAGIISLIVLEEDKFMFMGIGGLVVTVVIGVLLNMRIKTLEKTDLANEMRRVLLPFALVMQEEIKPGTKLLISLDANRADAEAYLADTQESGRRYGRTIKTYQQEWLSASATLIDGASLRLSCSKTVYNIDIVKQSASGKTKYKKKQKSRDDVLVKMLAPKSVYQLSNRDYAKNISLVDAADSFALRGKYKFKTDSMKTLQVQVVLDLIHQMYWALKPKGQAAASGRG